MSQRKEKIRKGLEIDFDLLDSDMFRCCIQSAIIWTDGPVPHLLWTDFVDREDWTEGMDPEVRVMVRTLDNERELAEGRRMLRLLRYKSYPCLAALAKRKKEKGEFVIRMPPAYGNPKYVCDLDEARMPAGFGDPDAVTHAETDFGFQLTWDFALAQRFSHAEAIRLTIRILQVLGYDIPGDHGNYYEPVRADIAEELHTRARRRPRRGDTLYAMINDTSREP